MVAHSRACTWGRGLAMPTRGLETRRDGLEQGVKGRVELRTQ